MPESEFEVNLRRLRREKLVQIEALGQQAYPNSYAFSHTVPAIRAAFDARTTDELEATKVNVSLAGRLMAIRIQGKAGFAQLQQGGERLQIYVRKDAVGEDQFALYKLLDLGDHIGVRGHLFRTRTGELTVHVEPVDGAPALTFLTKAMLALPDKYHGLEDTELRYRQRYVDLFMNTGQTPAPASPSQNPVILSEAKDPCISPTVPTQPGARPSQSTAPGAPSSQSTAPGAPSSPTASSSAKVGSPETTSQPETLNVRETFVKRAAILRAIRKFFDDRDYLEVETPMLHTVAGGAAARPFTTHHNTLDIDLSLRIAPELFLKRLVVGGLDRVYEINRNFRNEGVSTKHNPEFTMLEFYQAYSNYEDLMNLTEELIKSVAMEVNGSYITHFTPPNKHFSEKLLSSFELIRIDLGKWNRFSMREAIIEFWKPQYCPAPSAEIFSNKDGFFDFLVSSEAITRTKRNASTGDMFVLVNEESLREAERQWFQSVITSCLYELAEEVPLGKVISTLFEDLAEPHLIQPTIIYDFPLAVSPLSKQKPNDPDWVERFEFYIGGFEVGNAFSELNDPDEQRARFEAQVADKDPESMAEVDEDYVRALSYGLPPTAGEGIGIDRLTMILTGAKSIRDVILFPLMRPHAKPAQTE